VEKVLRTWQVESRCKAYHSMSKYQPFLNLNIHINVTHIPASKQVQCRWIFHCQTITVGTPMIFPTIPNVEIWFHIFPTFFYFLVFCPQAPVWSPMCPTSSINLVQWTLGCVRCPGYPHSRLIPQGNLRAPRPWVTNDTSRRERERWSPPIQKEITVPKHKNAIHVKFQR